MADDYEDDFDYLDDFEDAAAAGAVGPPGAGSPGGGGSSSGAPSSSRAAARLARQRSALIVTSLDALYDKLRDGKVKYGVVQAPEQRLEAGCQCEVIPRVDAVVQAPDDLGAPSRSMSSLLAEMGASKSSSEALRRDLLARLDDRATRFFRAASTVVERLLEQNSVAGDKARARREGQTARGVGSGAPVFSGPPAPLFASPAAASYAAAAAKGGAAAAADAAAAASPLAAALRTPLLRDRPVLCTAASPLRPEVMAIALGPAPPRLPGAPAAPPPPDGALLEPRFRAASLVVLLDTGLCATARAGGGGSTATKPPASLLHVLLCWGRPTAVCFDTPPAASNFGARGSGAFVFAGTAEGTLHMWSLEEPAWMHPQVYGSVPAEGSSSSNARLPLRLPSGLRAPSYSASVAAAPPAGEDAVEALAVPPAPVRSITPITRYPAASLFNNHEKQVLAREITAAVSAVEAASPRRGRGGAAAPPAPAALPGEDGAGDGSKGAARNRFLRGLPPMGAGLGSVLGGGGGPGARRLGGGSSAASMVGGAAGAGLAAGSSGAASGEAANSAAASLSVQVLAVDENGAASIWTPVVVSRAGAGGAANRARQADGEASSAASGPAGASSTSSFNAGGVLTSAHRDAGGRLSLGLLDLIDTRDLGRSTSSRMKLVCVARLGADGGPSKKSASMRNGEAGSEAGAAAGAAAGSRLSRLALAASLADGAVPGDGTAADVCPADPTKYAIGVSGQAGRIHLRNRSGEDAATSATTRTVLLPFNPCEAKSGAGAVAAAGSSPLPPIVPNASATSLAFHPLFSSFLLAGFGDGTVALYSIEHAVPLTGWSAPWMPPGGGAEPTQPLVCPVLRVAWLPSRPSCFCAADARGWVGVWDLEATPARPVAVVNLGAALPSEVAAAAPPLVGFDVLGGTDLAPASVTLVGTFGSGHVVAAPLHAAFAVAAEGDAARTVRRALEGIGL